ncbi:D-arabinono-1,4-lactone oxidase [Sorangium sp. So ce136]|uniref:D-arabinono-1,4-lactone oxidase n=1 Tax=Sorangium sp. So ce136 TaxID=3133284 RepID=UPI003F027B6E
MGAIDRARRIARTWTINTVNSCVYLLSGGKTTLHEGHYDRARGTWSNWSKTFSARPRRFETPESEAEIRQAVRSSKKVRVVGGGHTFNGGPLTGETMLSLDRYNKVLSVDPETGIARVQAGIRLRDLMAQLQESGLSLPVLGSTSTQSVGGLVATDLHGSGRANGFLSEQVRSLRIVNAAGEAETFQRGSEVFHAAFGAIGTCGVVSEVELECIPAYNLGKELRIVRSEWIDRNIDRILEENEHTSFYYIGGVDIKHVRMNLWRRTVLDPPASVRAQKMLDELIDMLLSGYLLGLARVLKVSRPTAALGLLFFKVTMDGRSVVHPSADGFSRKLFYHHDEIEYGVPYEVHKECLKELEGMLQENCYTTIIEVRFTPDKSRGLIGPGVGRRTCYIELAPSLSLDSTPMFEEAERIFLKYDGYPHLGKFTRLTAAELQAIHGDRFASFQRARRRQDPEGKFLNEFAARVLGIIEVPINIAEPSMA